MAPARAFVLIDALPRREQDAFEALGKFPSVVSRRLLPQRVGQGDILALVEAPDKAALERVLTNELRSVPFAHGMIRVTAQATLLGPVMLLMEEMSREADGHKSA